MNMRNNFVVGLKVYPVSWVWHQPSTPEDIVDCVDLRLAAKTRKWIRDEWIRDEWIRDESGLEVD